ncbi:hypothetical protein WOLCODRAFT_137680 [Wolfiporia cocos MD-104 SS10]|uniref:Uncharacterized protein n=1 Tax=Wolfiporia cocos (strain MD-104) TaxID=742152 RepID=A0A2H3JW62_WOLCO|nr:hypothetical protein WOLCODRAFT_137680 [Wolfiporia cocos MD-104 SS10]
MRPHRSTDLGRFPIDDVGEGGRDKEVALGRKMVCDTKGDEPRAAAELEEGVRGIGEGGRRGIEIEEITLPIEVREHRMRHFPSMGKSRSGYNRAGAYATSFWYWVCSLVSVYIYRLRFSLNLSARAALSGDVLALSITPQLSGGAFAKTL